MLFKVHHLCHEGKLYSRSKRVVGTPFLSQWLLFRCDGLEGVCSFIHVTFNFCAFWPLSRTLHLAWSRVSKSIVCFVTTRHHWYLFFGFFFKGQFEQHKRKSPNSFGWILYLLFLRLLWCCFVAKSDPKTWNSPKEIPIKSRVVPILRNQWLGPTLPQQKMDQQQLAPWNLVPVVFKFSQALTPKGEGWCRFISPNVMAHWLKVWNGSQEWSGHRS